MGAPSGGARSGVGSRAGGDADAPEGGRRTSYRSMPALVTGVVLLLFGAALALDAVIEGTGRGPWIAACSIVGVGVLAYSLAIRPVVRVGADTLLIRNPFRDITLTWDAITEIRSVYSVEVCARSGDGRQRRYQVWAVPVSLHARKRANRASLRASGGRQRGLLGGLGGLGGDAGYASDTTPERSFADQFVDELNTLCAERTSDSACAERTGRPTDAERASDAADVERTGRPTDGVASGRVQITWCWPVLASFAAAVIAVAALLALT